MKLDDFIRAHRDDFDSREPSDRVWHKVEHRLFRHNTGWNSLQIWRVAAILLFGCCTFLLGSRWSATRPTIGQARELVELQQFYSDEIAKKVALISTFENRLDEDQFSQELRKLEAMYQVLEEQMKRKPSAEVKDALVLNMLVRIDLLNQQIKKLEDSKSLGLEPVKTIGV
jgi:hypothetical protein